MYNNRLYSVVKVVSVGFFLQRNSVEKDDILAITKRCCDVAYEMWEYCIYPATEISG
jgi:hypothetical protein